MTSDTITYEMHCTSPMGILSLRTWCMPEDTNPYGDIFGGYLLGQMDIAGALHANREAEGRTVTIASDRVEFHHPVAVGDILCCYTDTIKTGTTSITVKVEAWATRKETNIHEKVTEGIFTYVAIDENKKPRPIPQKG